MKKVILMTLTVFSASFVFAQVDTTVRRVTPSQINLSGRSNDHLLIQIGYAGWSGTPDSIDLGGLPRTFNTYFMFDFPFKTSPKLSVAIGAGIATDNIYFDNTEIGLKEVTATLRFRNVADTNHFKKYKLATTWLEAPLELRFSANPSMNTKSFKVAIGAKFGLLLQGKTKGKTLETKNGDVISNYTQKEITKRFFNTNRISGIARIGYGNFSLFGSYALTPLFKEGLGPEIRPYSIGLTLSGL